MTLYGSTSVSYVVAAVFAVNNKKALQLNATGRLPTVCFIVNKSEHIQGGRRGFPVWGWGLGPVQEEGQGQGPVQRPLPLPLPDSMIGTHNLKHYLPATSLAGGKNTSDVD